MRAQMSASFVMTTLSSSRLIEGTKRNSIDWNIEARVLTRMGAPPVLSASPPHSPKLHGGVTIPTWWQDQLWKLAAPHVTQPAIVCFYDISLLLSKISLIVFKWAFQTCSFRNMILKHTYIKATAWRPGEREGVGVCWIFGVVIPGVQDASPFYHKRAKKRRKGHD